MPSLVWFDMSGYGLPADFLVIQQPFCCSWLHGRGCLSDIYFYSHMSGWFSFLLVWFIDISTHAFALSLLVVQLSTSVMFVCSWYSWPFYQRLAFSAKLVLFGWAQTALNCWTLKIGVERKWSAEAAGWLIWSFPARSQLGSASGFLKLLTTCWWCRNKLPTVSLPDPRFQLRGWPRETTVMALVTTQWDLTCCIPSLYLSKTCK